ncbi:recombinase family protein [Chryseobacterium kwangjuense]|uniref:Transposase n=1 Tax=Chryseobacterium kwangjuense TaxID=267125 RepID=A0A135WEV5_9FLAO|nr:recombinase family protein [Chryseobacterium kwangjuense]KXH83415.1 transposase [Chryseobacterium kwangjuense]
MAVQNFKNIHIGNMIRERVTECQTDTGRICNFLKCTKDEINAMYESPSLDTDVLMRWSKLLEYDFFRVFSHHLVLYAPQSRTQAEKKKISGNTLPTFRKNLYTIEIIDFILEKIETGEKTIQDIITEYRIPKTTLYKWISKYKK